LGLHFGGTRDFRAGFEEEGRLMAIVDFPMKTASSADELKSDLQDEGAKTLREILSSLEEGKIVGIAVAVVESDGSSWGVLSGMMSDALLGALHRVGYRLADAANLGLQDINPE
jgi:hypothetical protein